ncbi:MAG: type II toxin-antitoxin system VapC family toxin [bacterium]
MKKIVYIETTIPSFYYEVRTEPEMAARRNWTREWWDSQRHYYQLVTSLAVIEELENGDYPNKEQVLQMLTDVPILSIPMEIRDVVDTYIARKLLPANPKGDALHLALASFYSCDFLLTWNCQHLANANKFAHIRRINTLLGLFVPILTTPFELLSQEE